MTKEVRNEFDNWQELWGTIGVWFGNPALGIRVVLAVAVIFSFVNWVSVYEFFYGVFSYDSVVNFSRIEKIQKHSYLYEANAIAFSSIMTTISKYIFYPVFVVVAVYYGIKNGLPRCSLTKKRILSIPCFLIYSFLIIYWVLGAGFEGPARFFGDDWFFNKYFLTYIIFYFLIMYISVWLGFLGAWLLVSAVKVYFFGNYSES